MDRLRPDLASPPLAQTQYAEFVRAQTAAGVSVLEFTARRARRRRRRKRCRGGAEGVPADGRLGHRAGRQRAGAELSKTFGRRLGMNRLVA